MKKIIFLFVAALWCSAISAQCPPGTGTNPKLVSQEDIDDFCGSGACTVAGNLRIEYKAGETPITDLSGLSCITEVMGELLISGCDALTSLDGLGGITSVGQLTIMDNDVLENINGLENLTTITGGISITGNPNIGSGGDGDCLTSGICIALPPGVIDISGNNAGGCNIIGDFALAVACNALPVELITFMANVNERSQTVLYWETASEINNDYFELEHSVDGTTFYSIGRVEGNGNSDVVTPFSFLHENPVPGSNYYRLKQVDFDGQYEYFSIVSVDIEVVGIEIFPNPTTGIVKIFSDQTEAIEIKVFDSTGRVVTKRSGLNIQQLDLSEQPNGMYFIEIQLGNKFKIQRIVKE